MPENPNTHLLSLLKKIRAISVDKTAEKAAYKLIQKSLQNFEAKIDLGANLKAFRNEASSVENESNFTTNILINFDKGTSCSLENVLKDFPVFKFIAIFVINFFQHIKNYPELPPRLESAIVQVQLPLFRLAMSQPKIILNAQHPSFLLINELIDYTPFWKDESKVGFPTYTKLSHLLSFSDSNKQQLTDRFSTTLKQVVKIKNNQQKRALIFEKRLKETEQGKAKIATANDLVNKIITLICELKDLPEVLSEVFNNPWRKLLQLEYLRADNKSFNDAIQLMKSLIVSLKPITSRLALNQLFEGLPAINQQLKAGFDKTSLDENQSEDFIAKIEAMHIALISESEQTIIEESASGLESSTPLKSTHNASAGPEEILRLKPSDIFGTSTEETIDEEPALPIEETNISGDDDPVDQLFMQFDKDIQLSTSALMSNSFDASTDPALLKLLNDAKQNPWFWFLIDDKKSLHKLILSLESVGEHIFVDIDGNKSHQLTTEKMLNQLKALNIKPLEKNNIYADASDLCLSQLNEYVKEISNLELQKTKKIQQESERQQLELERQTEIETKKTETKPAATESLENNSNIESLEGSLVIEQSIPIAAPKKQTANYKKIDVNAISVGTWLKIVVNNEARRCKLAAIIASKKLHIFVDRQGKKICELSPQELTKKINDGEIIVINAELTSGKSLESIISTNRSMKS